MHYHYLTDETGDTVDLVPFCSDGCHRTWCATHDETYGGWNGASEGGDSSEWCAACGVLSWVGLSDDSIPADALPVVVGRFPSELGKRSGDGSYWVQLPAEYVS